MQNCSLVYSNPYISRQQARRQKVYSMYSQLPSIAGGCPPNRNPRMCHAVVIRDPLNMATAPKRNLKWGFHYSLNMHQVTACMHKHEPLPTLSEACINKLKLKSCKWMIVTPAPHSAGPGSKSRPKTAVNFTCVSRLSSVSESKW
jgi:hypothetical protein